MHHRDTIDIVMLNLRYIVMMIVVILVSSTDLPNTYLCIAVLHLYKQDFLACLAMV